MTKTEVAAALKVKPTEYKNPNYKKAKPSKEVGEVDYPQQQSYKTLKQFKFLTYTSELPILNKFDSTELQNQMLMSCVLSENLRDVA